MASGTIHSEKAAAPAKPLSNKGFSRAGIIGSVAALMAAAIMASTMPGRLGRK